MRRGLRQCAGAHNVGGTVTNRKARLIAVTGGPGAGKTALLELARQHILCSHCVVLTEAATIAFGGGFPRLDDIPSRKSAQRVIYHIQRELEVLAQNLSDVALILCDRGTPDNLAYWPERDHQSWGRELGTNLEEERKRYDAVIHMEPPSEGAGYIKNELRLENADAATELDSIIQRNWQGHPQYFRVSSHGNFLEKAEKGLDILRQFLPPCCSRASN